MTLYGYNEDTNVLEWVQYPKDTAQTRTEYTYDTLYRLAAATVDVDTGYSLDASYTYTDDLLTAIETNSTTYNFTYGDFSQINQISVGNQPLATYSYTDDADRYLEQLTYGNGDYVRYTYDDYGRVIQETFEDGDTVTYQYDNSGALAAITDSATGITTRYYYDFTDRLMKYVESDGTNTHSVGYEYDSLNNLTQLVETINGVEYTATYSYDEDNRVENVVHSANAGQNVVKSFYEYDVYGRTTSIVTEYQDCESIIKDYYFSSPGANLTSGRITNYQVDAPGFIVNYDITYDDDGNITSVAVGSQYFSYVYDSANQLIRENNSAASKTWVWSYDDAGNILSRTEYAYTTGELGTALDTVLYSYNDSQWGNLLTAYDGNTITYDGIGNPLTYGSWSYTWEHGRELMSMTNGSTTWSYAYDVNGMRTSRTNGTTTYSYIYNGSQLEQMSVGSNVLNFVYDANGAAVCLIWNGTPYYYVTTLQGDIQLILDMEGTIVVSYDYDAWGNIVNTGGSMSATLGVLNPLTYRGYVYDYETGLYYLQTRYYNPEWGRFLNADGYTSTGQGLLGNNMFAYCLNNPVNRTDATGSVSLWYFLIVDHDMGFIHRAVQAHILANYDVKVELILTGARADIVKGSAVWEVKHAGLSPLERITQAQNQAKEKYIGKNGLTHLGAAGAFNGSFYVSCGEYSYCVSYTTPASGAVLYTVKEVQDYDGEYFRSYQPHFLKNTQTSTILSTIPSVRTQVSGHHSVGGGSLLAGALLLACVMCSKFMAA